MYNSKELDIDFWGKLTSEQCFLLLFYFHMQIHSKLRGTVNKSLRCIPMARSPSPIFQGLFPFIPFSFFLIIKQWSFFLHVFWLLVEDTENCLIRLSTNSGGGSHTKSDSDLNSNLSSPICPHILLSRNYLIFPSSIIHKN